MIQIESYMINELKLTGANLLVYADICSHITNGYCTVTQPQIAAELGTCTKTVLRSIAYLKDRKLISVKPYYDGGVKRNVIKLNGVHIKYTEDPFIKVVLAYWYNCTKVEEEPTADVINSISKATRYIISKGYKPNELLKCIQRYYHILMDKQYYKTHIYKLANFLTNKVQDYLENGSEWREYLLDYNKRAKSGDTIVLLDPMKKNYETLSEEELGSVEM